MSKLFESLWTLPDSWVWATMNDVATVIGGGTPSTSDARNFGGSVPWITPADLSTHKGKTIWHGARFLSQLGLENSGARWLPSGTVLFSSRAPIGYTAVAGQAVATNQGFKSFIPRSGISTDFTYYWLTSAKHLAEQLATGTTFLELSGANAAKIPFPIAPASEQIRIVEKLEELLSDLDAGVAELKAAQKKLALYRQSLLKAAVEGTLTADWRAERAARGEAGETGAQLLARILRERRTLWEAKQLARFAEQGKAPPKGWQDKYPEPIAPVTAELPPLPEGWALASLDQLANIGTGVTPLRSKAPYFDGGSIPWVTSGALNSETVTAATELVTNAALVECRLEIYPQGTLLVAMYGEGKTRGKCSELLIPATINQAIAAIVLDPAAAGCRAFVKTFLLGSYERMRSQSSGGVQPNLNLQIVKSLTIPLPPIMEQGAISAQLASQLDHIREQQTAIEHALKQAAAQRKNILKSAFSGQLVAQDPTDEPASALLARIRAEGEGRPSVAGKRRGRQPGKSA